jgi:hypothetical protein
MLAVVVSIIGISAFAEEGAADKPKKEKADKAAPQLADLTLTGKITKMEKKNPKGEAVVAYVLVMADGAKVNLPKDPKDADGKAIDLAGFVDADVKLVAKGTEADRGGKKVVMVKQIVSVEKAAAAGAPEEKAPAPAPAQ